MTSEEASSFIVDEHDFGSPEKMDTDTDGEGRHGDGGETSKAAAARASFSNLYRLDLNKFGKKEFPDIIQFHVKKVKSVERKSEDVSCADSTHLKRAQKWIFTTEQSVPTKNQEDAGIGARKNAFSITYFEASDGNIYVAGDGSSFHYLKEFTDYEFPEWVLDKNLEDDVLEIHGKGLRGRIAIYSEKFRQEHSQMENLWVHMNSLTTKLKVPVRADSELGKIVCQKDKKVFVDVNFENNSVQVKKRMHTDQVMKVLDALVSSFENTASRQCAQLRLVSRVRDTSVQKKLDEKLNDFLENRYGEHSPAAVGKGATALSKDQGSECLVLHAYDDKWNEASKIVLETLAENQTSSTTSPEERKPRETTKIDYHPYEVATELFVELHKIFRKDHGRDFLLWLEQVDVLYSKKKKKLLSLMECRFPFLLDGRCHMYFHGQWLSFHSDFHSLLETHFLELMKTRNIEANLILPLAWPNSKDQLQRSTEEKQRNSTEKEASFREDDFARFLAFWLEMRSPTDAMTKKLQEKEPYKKLIQCLSTVKMDEPQYNDMYALVGQLMDNPKERGFIVGDGVTLKGGLELFDLLYYDKERVFFIHVKKGFSADNMRIVVDQVRQSAEFIQCLTFRGEKASREELKAFFRQLKYCQISNGKCRRHGTERWACEAKRACMKDFNASKFTDFLTSREKHFVLAYGGSKLTKMDLDKITGKEVDDMLEKHYKRVEALASNGYVKQVARETGEPKRHERTETLANKGCVKQGAGEIDKSRKYMLTSRFCVETEENFVKCMQGEEEMTDGDLLDMFKGLKGAISTTETSAGKMAFLNLFGSFSNFQGLKLHFCRIDHKFPDDEATDELAIFFENLRI